MTAQNLIREDVYRRMREEILSCALPPGTELREATLAERFAVSKSPVRDALHRLRAEGLIRVEPRKGYRVVPLSLADAEDLFDLRLIIEESCIMRGAQAATDRELDALEQYRTIDLACPSQEWVEYNRQFHHAVVGLCPNKRLVALAHDIVDQFDRLIAVSISIKGAPDRGMLLAEHCAVIDALQARDARKAAKQLIHHISQGKKRVIAALSQAVVVP